jgi:hypothetical protein
LKIIEKICQCSTDGSHEGIDLNNMYWGDQIDTKLLSMPKLSPDIDDFFNTPEQVKIENQIIYQCFLFKSKLVFGRDPYLYNVFVQVVIIAKKPVVMRQDRFNNPALVAHVSDHTQHIIISWSHQSRSENDGQIPDFHFIGVTVCNNLTKAGILWKKVLSILSGFL